MIDTQNQIHIHDGFKFREFFNVQTLKMKDTGTFTRITMHYERKANEILSRYDNQQYYDVESEGVNFHQIKYILMMYVVGVFVTLLIFGLEILAKKLKIKLELGA